jgi:hypothetical protein
MPKRLRSLFRATRAGTWDTLSRLSTASDTSVLETSLSKIKIKITVTAIDVIPQPMRKSRVVDPHWFDADPDPAFFLIADPDPGFWWPKIEKN